MAALRLRFRGEGDGVRRWEKTQMHSSARPGVRALATLVLGLALSTGAKEWKSDEAGVSFQIPDDPS